MTPTVPKFAPLKSADGNIVTDKRRQVDRCFEHSAQLYLYEVDIATTALDALLQVPVMNELDDEPLLHELD